MDKITSDLLLSRFKGNHILNLDDFDLKSAIELIKLISPNDMDIVPIEADKLLVFNQSTINVVLCILGLYTAPTIELVNWLKTQIDGYNEQYYPDAIEIASGTGWLGKALEIPCTDSRLQERQDIKKLYYETGQYTINYPAHVIKLDAVNAVKKYQPEFVIASYATSKYGLGGKNYGNMYGIDNLWIANNCHKYFFIGNLVTHAKDPLLKRKHEELSFPWLITRGDSSKSRIFIFENKQWRR